jgi:hypothetical protein
MATFAGEEDTPSLAALNKFPPQIRTMQAQLEETRRENDGLRAQVQGLNTVRDQYPMWRFVVEICGQTGRELCWAECGRNAGQPDRR